MSRDRPDLRDLLGDEVDADELERLQRVHELLVAAGPPPELSPRLQSAPPVGRAARSRPFSWFGNPRLAAAIALAVAAAAAFFGIGFLVGHVSGGGFEARGTVVMHGTDGAPNARASIEVGHADASGNVPMLVHVSGLPKQPRGYYEMFLTKKRKPFVSCGTFNGGDRLSVRLSIPYPLKRYDGWVVTRERWGKRHPGAIVLTTFA